MNEPHPIAAASAILREPQHWKHTMINLTPESRAALHELLDIALNSDNGVCTVQFCAWAHCGVVDLDFHPGGWKEGRGSDYQLCMSLERDPKSPLKALERAKAYLDTKNLTAKREAVKMSRLASLRAQLAEAEKETCLRCHRSISVDYPSVSGLCEDCDTEGEIESKEL